MDKLEFRIKKEKIHGNRIDVVHIFINGNNLIDTLKDYELPFAKKEGRPKLAGSYGAMTPGDFIYWFTKADWPSSTERPIFSCRDCGEVGCWPMLISESKSDKTVKWFNFSQTHRDPESEGLFWDYSDFPSFEFTRENYDNEFKKVEKLISK